jgi:hypothetical protein
VEWLAVKWPSKWLWNGRGASHYNNAGAAVLVLVLVLVAWSQFVWVVHGLLGAL